MYNTVIAGDELISVGYEIRRGVDIQLYGQRERFLTVALMPFKLKIAYEDVIIGDLDGVHTNFLPIRLPSRITSCRIWPAQIEKAREAADDDGNVARIVARRCENHGHGDHKRDPGFVFGRWRLWDLETVGAAVALAEAQIIAGADILDIGGESTRPGSDVIDAHTEKSRILPVIEEIKGRHPDVALSVDTYRAEVAAAALDRGADIINDVWAACADPDMASVMAERGVPVVLMHNQSRPNAVLSEGRIGGEYIGAEYSHVVDDVIAELAQLVDELLAAKVARGANRARPGYRVGKTVDQNLALLRHLNILKASLDLPFLIGTSRKSFIGRILDLPVEDRLEGGGHRRRWYITRRRYRARARCP